MSRSAIFSYEAERELKHQIFLERVSTTTERFYNHYLEQFEQMQRRGYAKYIPDEMERLRADLADIRIYLVSDPVQAREISFEVGRYIRSLYGLAEAAQSQFARAERMRQAEERERERILQEKIYEETRTRQAECIELYYTHIGKLNPAVAHFAQASLTELRDQIQAGSEMQIKELQAKLVQICDAAEQEAAAWKAQTLHANRENVLAARMEELESTLTTEKLSDQAKTAEFVAQIRKLKQELAEGSKGEMEMQEEIKQLYTQIEDAHITEETRRQTVAAIIRQLQQQEFLVETPQMVMQGDQSFVKIIARKPSGKQVICNLDLQGKLAYKFDHYEGMACLKDIEQFQVDLECIYSVKLSDERIIWSNPDRLTKDANQAPSGLQQRGK